MVDYGLTQADRDVIARESARELRELQTMLDIVRKYGDLPGRPMTATRRKAHSLLVANGYVERDWNADPSGCTYRLTASGLNVLNQTGA